MVERQALDSGGVTRVDAGTMQLHTDFDVERGDVINVIPPQQAAIAWRRGGGCHRVVPVNAISFESRLVPGIHVVGDATIAAPMPKSAFAVNQQAKVCDSSRKIVERSCASGDNACEHLLLVHHGGDGHLHLVFIEVMMATSKTCRVLAA